MIKVMIPLIDEGRQVGGFGDDAANMCEMKVICDASYG